jgi:type IV secretory pathway VirB2 component (pilin)
MKNTITPVAQATPVTRITRITPHIHKVVKRVRRGTAAPATQAVVAALAATLVYTQPALAASQLDSRITNLGNEVISVLNHVSVVIGVITSILAGYKFMGGDGHGKEQAKGLFIGALFCFGAPFIVQSLQSALS